MSHLRYILVFDKLMLSTWVVGIRYFVFFTVIVTLSLQLLPKLS